MLPPQWFHYLKAGHFKELTCPITSIFYYTPPSLPPASLQYTELGKHFTLVHVSYLEASHKLHSL